MTELLVSLVRNGSCLLKSLLPADHLVMKPIMALPLGTRNSTQHILPAEPFSGLEGFIGLLQLAGAGFNFVKGIKGLWGGIAMADYIVRWQNALADYDLSGNGKRREIDMLSDVLARQDAANNRRMVAGICHLVIGSGFLCLTLFSWKAVGITTTATALVILEVALAVMLSIAMAGVSKIWTVTAKVQSLEQSTASDVDIVEFLAPLAPNSRAWEPDVRVAPMAETLRDHMEGMSRIGKAVSETRLEDYQRLAQMAKRQAMLDAFLIALNVAAFLGYGAIPLDVFFPEREVLSHLFPPGETAWWGNIIGDMAWTIEPITMILAPYLLLRSVQPNMVGNLKSE